MRKLLESTITVWALLGGVLLLTIVLVTTVNVGAFTLDRIARLFDFHVPGLSGYEDFVRLGVSAAALMFFPYCQLRRGHVKVDLLVRYFPPRLQKALDILWLLITATIAVGLARYMLAGLGESRSDHVMSPVLDWPEWPFYAPGIISLILWAVVALTQIGLGQDTEPKRG